MPIPHNEFAGSIWVNTCPYEAALLVRLYNELGSCPPNMLQSVAISEVPNQLTGN